jgi:peptidoglycan/LPS O-acetylase OafA/YrhL
MPSTFDDRRPTVTPHRSNNFDALRLLGALLVLGSHQFAVSGRWEPRLVGDHSFGNLGVLIFFATSGYLVTSSWHHDPHLLRFALRRALRLLPAVALLLVVTGIALALWGPANFDLRAYALRPWSSQRAPYFASNPMTLLNGPLWTIPLEIKCYLVLALAGLLARRHLAAVVATGALALLAWYVGVLGGQAGLDRAVEQGHLSFLPYLGAFFLGGSVLAAWAPLRRHALWAVVAGLGCVAIGQHTLALALIVPPAVVLIGNRSWPLLRSAGRHGDLSYGLYLYAWPTQQCVVALLGANKPWIALLLPSLAGSLLLAWISWHIVERRALTLKPRTRIQSSPAAADASALEYAPKP